MAFVFENIPDKDLEVLKSLKIKDWSGAQLHPFRTGEKWCVDRERNAFSIALGGGREDMPLYWSFWWNNQETRIEVIRRSGGGNIETGWYIKREIVRIPVPQNLFDKRDELMKMIEEAFSIDAGYHKAGTVKSISVEIKCLPEIVN